MNPYIPFETALQFLVMVYVASMMFVLLASGVCLAVIETTEATD
ncbi:hypothetical protein SAMD00079811_58100 [Scytonema sp. HK-05]|nr:hypothetical protein [Scytonema sp. HK-05]BAY48189.1 hypothetical protein SAMD00079811_58100 [Scytonema sp. HK-05]